MILLKTSGQTIDKVVEHSKHALARLPSIVRGELILISQTEDSLRHGELPVRYVMEFVRCFEDNSGETLRIWGRRWKYIIEGTNLCRLKKPFRMSEVQVSGKNYGQGFVLFRIEPEDERHLQKSGYLEPIS
jgi:hypothetical protein